MTSKAAGKTFPRRNRGLLPRARRLRPQSRSDPGPSPPDLSAPNLSAVNPSAPEPFTPGSFAPDLTAANHAAASPSAADLSAADEKLRAALALERKSDPLESEFFDRDPHLPAEQLNDDLWVSTGEHPRDRHARWKEARVARYVTLAILAVSLTGIGGLLVYHKLVMPEPVSLASETSADEKASSHGLAQQLPGPEAVTPAAATLEPEPTPAVAPPAEPTGPQPPSGSDVPEPGGTASHRPAAQETASPDDPSGRRVEEGSNADPAAGAVPCCATAEKYLARLAEDPGNAETLTLLAGHYLEEGKNREAEGFALKAVEIDPSSAAGWITLGAAREALRDRAGAREAYRRCTDLGSGSYARECRNLLR
jgi:tetratricopeptide (TPR) repeat protein